MKFLVAVFACAVAVTGCDSNSNDAAGGGAGKTGTAGSTGGTDGSTAGTSGDAAGWDAGSESDPNFPVCNLETFCPIFLAYCGTTTPGYRTLAECMATYAAVGAADPDKQQCETFHLCNATADTGDDRTLHCSHAAGAGGLCG